MAYSDTARLISLVRDRSLLWNEHVKDYFYNVKKKDGYWMEICREMVDDFDGIPEEERVTVIESFKNWWNYLRDRFIVEYRNVSKDPTLGTEFEHFDHLKFLVGGLKEERDESCQEQCHA
ncbi:uncharacterized protein LOC128896251 [Hylaeus anthracinus]|uniref:uncharacterized protein LOC128896251 n=1 Tax=Hylaeus anthracinus TaxID=313031 RepID=UPI0023B8E9E1|nr:uncharacterized protein LOC128896251 [Hylaeus anthracinus]